MIIIKSDVGIGRDFRMEAVRANIILFHALKDQLMTQWLQREN